MAGKRALNHSSPDCSTLYLAECSEMPHTLAQNLANKLSIYSITHSYLDFYTHESYVTFISLMKSSMVRDCFPFDCIIGFPEQDSGFGQIDIIICIF